MAKEYEEITDPTLCPELVARGMLYWQHNRTKERLPYMAGYQHMDTWWWEKEILRYFPAILVDDDED